MKRVVCTSGSCGGARIYCEHHFSNFFVYIFYERIVKNGAGNGCGTSHIRSISIPEVLNNFHIEILYNEAEAHFDLSSHKCSQYPHSSTADNCIISLSISDQTNAHAPPPQLTTVSYPLVH